MKNGDFDYSKLAALILNKRTKENVSFRAMAEQTGITISTCHRAEAAAGGLMIDNVIVLCNWLDMQVQNFLTPKSKSNGKSKKAGKGKEKA